MSGSPFGTIVTRRGSIPRSIRSPAVEGETAMNGLCRYTRGMARSDSHTYVPNAGFVSSKTVAPNRWCTSATTGRSVNSGV